MRFVATVGDKQYTVEIEAAGQRRRVLLDGREIPIDWLLVGAARSHLTTSGDIRADQYSVLAGTHSYDVFVRALETEDQSLVSGAARQLEVLIGGLPYDVTVQDAHAQALASLAAGHHVSGDVAIRAPMPGLVSNVLAPEGTRVERGQTIIVLEAMKMENDLTAPRAGIVKVVRVAKGQAVNQNDVLAIVGEPDTEPAGEGEGEEF